MAGQQSDSPGKRLKSLRLERNLTQDQLAKLLGTTKLNISRWERGEIVPGLYYRQKLCELFQKDVYELGFLQTHSPEREEGSKTDGPASPAESAEAPSHLQGGEGPVPPTRASFPVKPGEARVAQRPFLRARWLLLGLSLILLGSTTGGVLFFFSLFLRAKPTPMGPPALHLPYIFHAPLGRDVFNVEWSPQGNALAAVIGNGTAQVLVMQQGSYRPTITIRAVNIATWSPDGTRIASANADGTVRIWNSATGAQVQEYGGHTHVASGLAWSPDGQYLASGDGAGVLRIWNVVSARLVTSVSLLTGRIWWLAWSPDGKEIAVAGEDHTVRIWEVSTQRTHLLYREHRGIVYEVMWSPDGQEVVSSSADGTARVWRAATGATLAIYHGHTDAVLAAVWSPDGKRIASASADGTVQIWEALTSRLDWTYTGHSAKVWSVSWSRDNLLASASADATLQVWQAPASVE